ncbi:hypothetical protein BDF22DRAFT_670996 [Syncephalis plumigaleata]|nr:hypothetical protein BDF22DRAFT_670996 [Syncephalis plumigaleata]
MSHHVGSSSSPTPPSIVVQSVVDPELLEISPVDNKHNPLSNPISISSNCSDSNNCYSSNSNGQATLSIVTRIATVPDPLVIDMDQSHCRTLSHVADTRTTLYSTTNHDKYDTATNNHRQPPSSASPPLTDIPLHNRLNGSQTTKELRCSSHDTPYQSDTAHIYSSTMDTLCGIDAWPSDNEEGEHVHTRPYRYQASLLDSSTTPTEPWPLRDKHGDDDGDGDDGNDDDNHDDVINTSSTLSKNGTSSMLTSDTLLTPPTAISRKKPSIAPAILPHRQSSRTAVVLSTTTRMTIVPSSEHWDTHRHGLAVKNNITNNPNNLDTIIDNNNSSSSSSNSNHSSDDAAAAANITDDNTSAEHRMTISLEDRSTITPWDVNPLIPPPPPTQPAHRSSTSTSESSSSHASHASFVWPPTLRSILLWYLAFTAIMIGVFEAFTVRLLSSDVRMGFQIGFAGLVALTLSAMLYTTIADTEDPVVREARRSGVQRNVNYRLRRGVGVRDNRGRCRVCRVVTASSTRHCKLCNKCVAVHDHHCRWLNCCIGHTNYWSFCVTVVASIATALMIVSISCYLLALAGVDHTHFARNGILGMTTSVFLTERRYSRERTRISWRDCGPAHNHLSTAASASSSMDTARNPWTQHIPRRTRFRRTLYQYYTKYKPPSGVWSRVCRRSSVGGLGPCAQRRASSREHFSSPSMTQPTIINRTEQVLQ